MEVLRIKKESKKGIEYEPTTKNYFSLFHLKTDDGAEYFFESYDQARNFQYESCKGSTLEDIKVELPRYFNEELTIKDSEIFISRRSEYLFPLKKRRKGAITFYMIADPDGKTNGFNYYANYSYASVKYREYFQEKYPEFSIVPLTTTI